MNKKGIIYAATNIHNGKMYIGQTAVSLSDRISKHIYDSKRNLCKNRRLYKTIIKYGIESFIWEILYKDVNEKDLDRLEIFAINAYDTFYTGYNCNPGGAGNRLSKGMYGRNHTEETKRKISEAHKCEN